MERERQAPECFKCEQTCKDMCSIVSLVAFILIKSLHRSSRRCSFRVSALRPRPKLQKETPEVPEVLSPGHQTRCGEPPGRPGYGGTAGRTPAIHSEQSRASRPSTWGSLGTRRQETGALGAQEEPSSGDEISRNRPHSSPARRPRVMHDGFHYRNFLRENFPHLLRFLEDGC
ncbi:hypothetical protein H1C71_027067 [Ictidomys tridecemlineatus]|nr:hypothetical protein H1C71_027067 [Ictidomys tridecemlineatus]